MKGQAKRSAEKGRSAPRKKTTLVGPDLPAPRLPATAPSSQLLNRSRTAWELGDWTALVALADRDLEQDDNRAKLALLAAVGLAQTGQLEEARIYAQMARDWGCPTALIARLLAGGALNSLGRAATLTEDTDAARRYFEASINTANPGAEAALLGQAREINEMIALGLLPEAAKLMRHSVQQMNDRRIVGQAEAEIFRSQVEVINHTIALAQKRHQLSDPAAAASRSGDVPLEQRAVSQLGQDLWVLEQTGYKTGGFFVEFGATDGVLLSNTLLLETEFGWNGICAEPNPAFLRKLRRNRSCTVAPDCIMGQSGQTVEFILADEFGGIAKFADSDQHAARRAAFRENDNVVTLQSISLDDFLKKYDAPRTIDYLSIDTEGSEYDILSSFPFEDWNIRLMTVEHNFTPMRQKIRALMEQHGYVCTEMQWDDWYTKSDAA